MTPFSLRLALGEVLRNLASAPLRTAILVIVSTSIASVSTLATITDVNRASHAAQQQYAAGSTAFEIVGDSGSRIDAYRCHALNSQDGVTAAGGIMHSDLIHIGVQPDADTVVVTTTPGFIPAAWPTMIGARSASLIAGSYYQSLGWAPGSTFSYTPANGRPTLAHIDFVADSVSILGHDRIIAATAPPIGTVRSCIVLAQPQARNAVVQAIQGWFGPGTTITKVMVHSDLIQDPQVLFNSRVSRYGWAAAAAVLIATILSHWIARRSEFALYRLNHVSGRGILTMFTLEMLLLVLIPAQIGILIAIGIRPIDSLLATTLIFDILRLDLLVVLAPLIGLLAVPQRSLLATLKGQ